MQHKGGEHVDGLPATALGSGCRPDDRWGRRPPKPGNRAPSSRPWPPQASSARAGQAGANAQRTSC